MSMKTECLATEGAAEDWEEAIRMCGSRIVEAGYAEPGFIDECIKREIEYPTGLPSEVPVAMPHCMSRHIKENCICFLKLKQPVSFRRMDDDEQVVNTRYVFNLALKADDHLQFLQRLMTMLMDRSALERFCEAPIDKIPALLSRELNVGMSCAD